MDQLSLHIEYLLLRHDCVIIPGIGAFIARDIPARIDASKGIVYPRRRETVFNSAVRNDDGLLANSIARRNMTGFEEGRRQALASVSMIRERLKSDGSVTLGRLGILSLGDDSQITFSPIVRGDRISEKIGHMPVSVSHRHKEQETASAAKTESKRRFRPDKYWYIPVNKRLARISACVMLVAGLALSVINGGGDTRMTGHRDMASVVPVEKIINITSPSEQASAEAKPSITTATSPSAESSVTTKPTGAKEEADASSARFHLIVATFGSRKEAEKYASESVDNVSVVGSKTLWRVSIASGDDRKELLDLLNDNDTRSRYPGAWIWSR